MTFRQSYVGCKNKEMKGIRARAENETKDSRGNKCLTDGMINWMKLFFQGVQISSRFTILFYINAESKNYQASFSINVDRLSL